MLVSKVFSATAVILAAGFAASAAPPEGKGGGKGGGKGEDPPAETFVPAIAYFEESRKSKDLKLANRAGDAACLIVRSNDGEPKLRGFAYHAASNTLAYSKGGSGIYLASWGEDPCAIGSGALIPDTGSPEFLDFSPLGGKLIWRETHPDYTGSGTVGTASQIFVYDLSSAQVQELPLDLWAVGGVRFSPEFESTGEIVFRGGPLDGSEGLYDSLFVYDIDAPVSAGSNPRKIVDGAGDYIDIVLSASSPGGGGEASVAYVQGTIHQVRISDGTQAGPSIAGYEPAYSCDNSEIIYRYPASARRYEVRISSSDGNSTETWTKADLRFFEWFCP